MATDKQIVAMYKADLDYFTKDFTKEHDPKRYMQVLAEAYEQAAWTEFNEDDLDTFPDKNKPVMTNLGSGTIEDYGLYLAWQIEGIGFEANLSRVTKWKYI